EVSIGRGLQRIFSHEYEVTAVTSVAAGVEQIEKSAPFELILCDVMMPATSGRDFFELAGEKYPREQSRTLFMTGGAFAPGAATFLETYGGPVIEKPFDVDLLRQIVRGRIAELSPMQKAPKLHAL